MALLDLKKVAKKPLPKPKPNHKPKSKPHRHETSRDRLAHRVI